MQRRFEISNQALGGSLRLRGEDPRHKEVAQRVAQRLVSLLQNALPTRFNLFRPKDHHAIKVKVFVDESRTQLAGGRVDERPAQVILPVINGLNGQNLVDFSEEFELTYIDLAKVR